MSGTGEAPTLNEQMAAFKTFATTDGEVSAGGETPEEAASEVSRQEADATARAAAQKPQRAESNTETDDTADNPASEGTDSGEVSQEESAAAQAAPAKPAKKTAAQRQQEIQARIDAATRELREIERRIEAAKAPAVATPQQALTEKSQGATEDADAPKPTDFEYGELDGRYIKALAAHEAKKAYAAEKAEDAKRQQQAAITREQAENRTKFVKVVETGAAKYDDFEEVVVRGAEQNRYLVSEVVARLVLGSDVGPDIAYHLATHVDEARQLAGKSPLEQAAYFGRLEARFSAPAQGATVAKAPKSAQQATQPFRGAKGGGGSTQTSPAPNDFAAFERMAMGG